MARIRKPINLTLPPDLVAALDRWCDSQEFPPRRTQAVEQAIREFLEKREVSGVEMGQMTKVLITTRTDFEHEEFWLDIHEYQSGPKSGLVEWAAVPKKVDGGSAEIIWFKTEQEARNWIEAQ